MNKVLEMKVPLKSLDQLGLWKYWYKMRKGRGKKAHLVFISVDHRVMKGTEMYCRYIAGETGKADLILIVESRAKIG